MRFAPIVGVTVAIVLMMRAPGLAQNVTEPALKAAFIYNFARFTAWPDEWPVSEPFVICVLGDAVGDALERVIKGRQLAAHPIVVSRATPTGPHRACHLLYVTGIPSSQAAQMVAGLRDAPVLTISDIEGFTRRGRNGAAVLRARTAAFQHQARSRQARPAAAQLEADYSSETP